MKILIARMQHETNAFSPVPTPLSSFGLEGPDYDRVAYERILHTPTAMAAFIDIAEEMGAEIVTPVSAYANPSGPVDDDAFQEMMRRILGAGAGCDAFLLDLHGAMITTKSHDAEGELLAAVRAQHPSATIVVSLDLHGNVTERMVRNANVITGYKTYPHLDMYDSGELAGTIFKHMSEGDWTPRTAWRQVPLMTHTMRSATAPGSAMLRAVELAKEIEKRDGIYGATVMAGFALSGLGAPRASTIVVAATEDLAQNAADEIATQIWKERQGFVYVSKPLEESIVAANEIRAGNSDGDGDQAQRLGKSGPVLLLDHGDNCMSGATCDTMDILEVALRLGLHNIAVGPTADPEAVAEMIRRGVGTEVELAIGNKIDLARIGRHQKPLVIKGKVRAISDGHYVMKGPIYHGMEMAMGRTVRLQNEQIDIIVSERQQESWDLANFECVGLDIMQKDYLILKSRMYCRPSFFPISSGYVECDSGGITSSKLDLFDWTKIERPVYPLDQDISFDLRTEGI